MRLEESGFDLRSSSIREGTAGQIPRSVSRPRDDILAEGAECTDVVAFGTYKLSVSRETICRHLDSQRPIAGQTLWLNRVFTHPTFVVSVNSRQLRKCPVNSQGIIQ